MKYSEATLVTSGDLTGTEKVMLSGAGVSKTLSLTELNIWTTPYISGPGLLVANPQTITGTRFADPRGLVSVPGSGDGLLVANPQTNSGTRFADPREILPEVTPVEPPTITALWALDSSSLRMTWQDNQVNASDEFIIYCIKTTDQSNAPGYPLTVSGTLSTWDITSLTASTNYTVSMVAREGSDSSPLSNIENADTPAPQQPGDFVPDSMLMTFEGLPVGTNAGTGAVSYPMTQPFQNNILYSDGRWGWEISDENVYRGTRSMKINIVNQVNSETNGVGGTMFNEPPYTIGEGQEYWWRQMVYLPTDFNPGTIGSSDVKWFRLLVPRPSGGQGGLEFKLGSAGSYWFDNENDLDNTDWAQRSFQTIPPPEDKWQFGAWQAFECYVRFSQFEGQGRVMFWRNNSLIYDRSDIKTLASGGTRMSRNQFISYWNCAMRGQCGLTDAQNDTVPRTQQPIYVDSVYATGSNNPPPNTDAFGNKYIGDWNP